MYFFARDGINDCPSLPIAALRDAWAQADGTPSRLHDLVTEQLAETAADAEAFELDLSVDGYAFILQDIVRRSTTLIACQRRSGFHLFEDAAGRVRRHGDARHAKTDHQRIHERPPRKVARRRLPVTLRLHASLSLSLNQPALTPRAFCFLETSHDLDRRPRSNPHTSLARRLQRLPHRRRAWLFPQRHHRQGATACACEPQNRRFPAAAASAAPRAFNRNPAEARAIAAAGRPVPQIPAQPRRPLEPPPLGPAPPIPVTVLTLTPATCNWPEGDPKRPGFHFCGRDKPHETPYCPHHAARAYR